MQKPSRLNTLLLAAAALLLGWQLPRHIAVSPTDSVGYKVFLVNRCFVDDLITTGSYVMFRMNLNDYFDRSRLPSDLLFKRVLCGPGDLLSTNGGDFYCNNRFLGKAVNYSSSLKPVSVFSYNGTVPKGHFFCMGNHERSYDSRYFGFVRATDVEAILYPVLEVNLIYQIQEPILFAMHTT